MSAEDHLPGCPAALSLPGARDECRCAELASLFDVPTRETCFGDPDATRAQTRWSAARADAASRYSQLMRELAADEQHALDRYRESAVDAQTVERHIRTARELRARLDEPVRIF